MDNFIKVKGARQHNLKNVDLDIPKNKLVVLTGVSGSGKSSFAFDTIYAEGQRRYVESLSSYARQFLGVMQKPDVDSIDGLSPAISIDQKTTSHNPRSTVGTVTEIYDYLRLLFARIGHPHCPICGREISGQTVDQIVGNILSLKMNRFLILAPVIKDRKGEFMALFENLKAKGFTKVRVDGHIKNIDDDFVLIKTNKHNIDVVIDRISSTLKDLKDKIFLDTLKSRVSQSVEQALELSDGLVIASEVKDKGYEIPDFPKDLEDHLLSEKFACPIDNIQLPEIEPRIFSFNTPHGACQTCTGLGKISKVEESRVLSEEISIKEGAILPFGNMFEYDTWFGRLVLEFCKQNSIDVHTNTKNLTDKERHLLLYGTGAKSYRVYGTNRFGRETSIIETFSGILAEVEKRYLNSESDIVRLSLEKFMREVTCPTCNGARLKKEALGITINEKSIHDVVTMPISESHLWVKNLEGSGNLNKREIDIAKLILKECELRLGFLMNVGLEYLTLARSAATLAGGEAQRIRLASQVGSGLTGVLYVLDEPTIGLHPRDNARLISTLKKLKDLGNTILVVEHDKEMMMESDYIVDFGPGAGKYGGAVVAKGTPSQILKDKNSITGKYLSGRKKIQVNIPKQPQFMEPHKNSEAILKIIGASENNLKNVDLAIPLGKLVAVTGVSGSGKSTLVVETIYHALATELNSYHRQMPGKIKRLEGVENIDKVILIDQSPIGRTPRSNPATYTKVFDLIRKVYASTREAKIAGYGQGRFSFNVKGGRCEACEGQGQTKIEMQFMSDIWITCEVCHGARYNSQTLDILYKGKNISEVLNMTVAESREFFHAHAGVVDKLDTLMAVGLGYVEFMEFSTRLFGGGVHGGKLFS